MKRLSVTAGLLLVVAFAGTALAAPKVVEPPVTALKASAALSPKFTKRIGVFTWGLTTDQTFVEIEKELDAVYAKKVASVSNPKEQTRLERERDKKKVDARTKLTLFNGAGGVNGYEMKTPGEFTHKNEESVIEILRPAGVERQIFFIKGKLWKVVDLVPLGKDSELGETWESAVTKLTEELGEKGFTVATKSKSSSYFGTLAVVPQHVMWSDGKTQVRLVDHTKREDMPTKSVAVAYEEVSTVEKLATLRSKVEAKGTDAMVDKAAGTPVVTKVPPTKTK